MYQIHSILFGYFVISGWPESKGVVILPKRNVVIDISICHLKIHSIKKESTIPIILILSITNLGFRENIHHNLLIHQDYYLNML